MRAFSCLLTLLLVYSGCRSMLVVQLQNGDEQSDRSCLFGRPGVLPNLTVISICARTNLRHIQYSAVIISYQSDFNDFSLGLDMRSQTLQFLCCSSVRTSVKVPVRFDVWQHWCVSFNRANSTVTLGFDGKVSEESNNRKTENGMITEGGHLAIGQHIGNFDGEMIFLNGRLVIQVADLQLYGQELTEEDMKRYMNCSTDTTSPEPILTLGSNWLETKGPAILANISETEVCGPPQPNVVLFSNQFTFREAQEWCSKYGGHLPLPEDNETDTFIYNQFLPSADQCVEKQGFFYWLGVQRNKTADRWVKTTDGEPIAWNNFFGGSDKVPKTEACFAVYKFFDYPIWLHTDCKQKMCFACAFDSIPQLRLRGMCPRTNYDDTLYITGYQNGSINFVGESHTRLQLNNGTWLMNSRIYNELRAEMTPKADTGTPIGRNEWTMEGDTCPQIKVQLVLTVCNMTQYTCDDGSCIAKEQRCNLLLDCPDHSDENQCDVLLEPPGYSPTHPPPSGTSQPLPLSVSLTIVSVREFSLNTFTIVLDTVLSTTWTDLRLQYKNLQSYNQVNDTQVWWPQTEILDATLGPVDVSHYSKTIYVNKNGSFLLPHMTNDYTEDVLYSGLDNALVMHEKQIISFRCHFDLQLYPFDVQRCSIIIFIKDLRMKYGVMIKDGPGVVFVGERVLLEYQLVAEIMRPYPWENTSYMMVQLRFQNLYGYYVGNVFVPSLMMVVVCYLTLFFTTEDFNDRIMVSLTSLLVLAGLFAQTSDSIPKTSYLKLVDGWYLTLISMDFLIIVTLVVLEAQRQHQPAIKTSVGRLFLPPTNPAVERGNTLAQRVFAVTLICIVAAFIALSQWDWE